MAPGLLAPTMSTDVVKKGPQGLFRSWNRGHPSRGIREGGFSSPLHT